MADSICNEDFTDESNVRHSVSVAAVEASIGHLDILQREMRENSKYPEAADDNGFIRNVGLSNVNQSRGKRAAGISHIWYLNPAEFEQMNRKTDAQKDEVIAAIEKALNIKWADVEFDDLEKPKVSMLAFLLYLHTQKLDWPIRDSETAQALLCGQIPSTCNTQKFSAQYKLYKKEIQTRCDEQDIVFVVDSSGSVGKDGFERVKDFIIKAIDELNIEAGGTVNLAVVVFGDSASTAISFDEKNKSTIKSKIKNTDWLNENTNTGAGLIAAKEILEASKGKQRTIALFTDGATSNMTAYQDAIQEIRQAKFQIMKKVYAFDNESGISAFKGNADNKKQLAMFNNEIRYLAPMDFEDSVLSLIKEICRAKIIMTEQTSHIEHTFRYQPSQPNQPKQRQRLDLQLDNDNNVYNFVEITTHGNIIVYVSNTQPKPNANLMDGKYTINPPSNGDETRKIPFFTFMTIVNTAQRDNVIELKLKASRRKRSAFYSEHIACQSNEICYGGICYCQDNPDASGLCPPEKFNIADIKLYEKKKLEKMSDNNGYGYDYYSYYELW